MDLLGVRALIDIAKHQSLQAAARASGTSRTTLRRRLEALEAEVGARLIHRNPDGITLTRAGQTFLARGQALLREAEAAVAAVQAMGEAPAGLLRVISPSGAPARMNAQILQMLWGVQPAIRVQVTESADPLSCLDQEFDLLLHFGPPPEQGNWYTRVVRTLPVGLMATPAYLERHGHPESLDDLVDHQVLVWTPAVQACERALGAPLPPTLRPKFQSTSDHLIRTLAAQGHGIAFSTRPPLPFDPLEDDGVLLLPDALDVAVPVNALSPLPSRDDPLVRSLLAQLFEGLQA